jgi:hypothetical protein
MLLISNVRHSGVLDEIRWHAARFFVTSLEFMAVVRHTFSSLFSHADVHGKNLKKRNY